MQRGKNFAKREIGQVN